MATEINIETSTPPSTDNVRKNIFIDSFPSVKRTGAKCQQQSASIIQIGQMSLNRIAAFVFGYNLYLLLSAHGNNIIKSIQKAKNGEYRIQLVAIIQETISDCQRHYIYLYSISLPRWRSDNFRRSRDLLLRSGSVDIMCSW